MVSNVAAIVNIVPVVVVMTFALLLSLVAVFMLVGRGVLGAIAMIVAVMVFVSRVALVIVSEAACTQILHVIAVVVGGIGVALSSS